MTRKREPVAELGDEDYRIVKHTHDVELAKQLMRAELIRAYGCPGGGTGGPAGLHGYCRNFHDPACPHMFVVGQPVPVWVRIVPALPNSWAAREGLRYCFNPANPGERGSFRAVEFR